MLTLSCLPLLLLLLLLSHLSPTTALYHIQCVRLLGAPIPLADCLDVLPRIPPATLLHDDFLRPITFQSGHCAIAVARDPPGTDLHPPRHIIPAMRDIVWPDIKAMAQELVRKCVRKEMGRAGMVLGCSYLEGIWYGYSVKVKFLPQAPVPRPPGIPLPDLGGRPGSPPRPGSSSPPGSPPRPHSPLRPDSPMWTSSPTSSRVSGPGAADEWKMYLA